MRGEIPEQKITDQDCQQQLKKKQQNNLHAHSLKDGSVQNTLKKLNLETNYK